MSSFMGKDWNVKDWWVSNGIGRIPLCRVCEQPIYEGHIGCTCNKNHPEICERPTYDQLKAQQDKLVKALEVISSAIHSDECDEMGALLEAIDKNAIAALEQVK